MCIPYCLRWDCRGLFFFVSGLSCSHLYFLHLFSSSFSLQAVTAKTSQPVAGREKVPRLLIISGAMSKHAHTDTHTIFGAVSIVSFLFHYCCYCRLESHRLHLRFSASCVWWCSLRHSPLHMCLLPLQMGEWQMNSRRQFIFGFFCFWR